MATVGAGRGQGGKRKNLAEPYNGPQVQDQRENEQEEKRGGGRGTRDEEGGEGSWR